MQKLLEGKFGRYILPGIILQSVLIGGGFATGREIVEFGAKFGAMGWMAGIGIFLGFTIASILTFEFARKFKTYNYRHFLKELIGPLWFLFDIIYILLAILIIAIMASATGEILQNTLGLNYWVGVGLIIIIVGLLNFYGKGLIERFKTFGTLSLMLGYILFAILVISTTWDEAVNVLSTGDTSFVGNNVTIGTVLWTGILYVGYNLAVYPATLFSIERQTSRKESVVAGLLAGIFMTVPWFLTYFSLLGHYPNEDVFGASVPWLQMLQGFPAIVIIIFGVVVGWTLVETSSGMIHAFVDRVDGQLKEATDKQLSQTHKGLIAVGALVLALILAQVGIIDLIATGYTAMAYAMIAVFMLPLLTIGVYKIFIKK
ncbi:YkvI family membrane protein [Piscibacillus sp. B03]|uniref:YkvI family membrane protein n=1 Tax=Piscibacillus sp. B03 TaxID=3457430 RepID=UPI003FCD1ECF